MNKTVIRKLGKWLNHILTVVLFVLLIGMLAIVIVSKASGGEPEVFGYQVKTVLSGSMEPDIKTGSIIAVKPGGDMTQFQKDDVITFMQDSETIVTHRIVDVMKNGDNTMYQTKGDNNNAPDAEAVKAENVTAEYTGFTVPYAGYFVHFAQSKNGAFLLLTPGILLLLYAGIMIWRALKEMDKQNRNEQDTIKQHGAEVSK